MPLNISNSFNNISSSIANHSMVGTILGNPLVVAFMIVFTILLILYVWDVENEMVYSFKFIFYMLFTVISIMVAHDVILKSQFNSVSDQSNHAHMVEQINDVAAYDAIEPRSNAQEIRNNFVNQMPQQQLLDSSELLI